MALRCLSSTLTKASIFNFISICPQTRLIFGRTLSSGIKDNINAGFDSQQTEHVLLKLNSMTAEDYANTGFVTVAKGISICRWRNSMGGFKNLSDILKITGVGHTLADQLCRHLITGETAETANNDKSTSGKPGGTTLGGCIPRMTIARAQSISKFAALDVGQNQVTWCLMSRDLTQPNQPLFVADWSRTQFLETPFVATKHSHATLHEKMVDVVYKHLPSNVDCYVAEFKRLRCPSLKFMPLVINQTIAETVLLTLLDSETYNAHSNLHKVFKLRPSAVTRLFGLSVGNERVSGHRIVESAINRQPLEGSENPGKEQFAIDFSPNALLRYKAMGDLERESFNVSFLLGVAFYELVLKTAEKAVQESDGVPEIDEKEVADEEAFGGSKKSDVSASA